MGVLRLTSREVPTTAFSQISPDATVKGEVLIQMDCCSDPKRHFQRFLHIIQFLNFLFSDIKWNSIKKTFGIKDNKCVQHCSGVFALCQCISYIDFGILSDPFIRLD